MPERGCFRAARGNRLVCRWVLDTRHRKEVLKAADHVCEVLFKPMWSGEVAVVHSLSGNQF